MKSSLSYVKIDIKGGIHLKLSMWIIANQLESFEPKVHIVSQSPRVLRSARLAYATECVYVYQDGKDCVYSWESDTIRLPDLSAREGFEMLQSLFDSMFDWHTKLIEAIDRKDLQRAIDLCGVVFHNPLYLSDSNHQCVALSSQYGPEDVDAEWHHLKTYGFSSIDSGRKMARGRITRHFHNRLMRYTFPADADMLNCTCAAIMQDSLPVGYMTVLEKDRKINQGYMQLLDMVSKRLALAMVGELEYTENTSPILKLLLDGKPLASKDMLALGHSKKWSSEHNYRVLLFQFPDQTNTMWMRQHYFLTGSLSASFPDDICGFQDSLFVMIANDTLLPHQTRLERLKQQLEDSHIQVAYSLPFPGLTGIPEQLKQAQFAMAQAKKYEPKQQFMDFYPLAVDYLIRAPYTPATCLATCHPDVYALYRSDEVRFQTLWVYLAQDRSVTRTIEHLYVHKNTLLHRLRKIEDSLTYSMADPYTRSYMRLSFRLLEQHAGLPFPPENPFQTDPSAPAEA